MLNFRGNVFCSMKRYDAAIAEYEAAIDLEPGNREYRENCAAACIEADYIHRADELLGRLAEESPNPRIYNMIGNACVIKGEFSRAEASYREGMSMDPADVNLRMNLADLLITLKRYDDARKILKEAPAAESERSAVLLDRIRDETEITLRCSGCGIAWRVPKVLEPQGRLLITGEPPGDCPAGECPACGKIYCVSCAADGVVDGRFMCSSCGTALKLTSDHLKYAVKTRLSEAEANG